MIFYSHDMCKNSGFPESLFPQKMLTGAIRESLFRKFRNLFISRKSIPRKFIPLKYYKTKSQNISHEKKTSSVNLALNVWLQGVKISNVYNKF